MDLGESEKAYVTLATDDTYAIGALVLGNSLRRAETKFKLVVLITPEVSETVRAKLKSVFNEVQEVNLYESNDEEKLSLMKRPELGKTFTKLHIWKLINYSKCVFLDADTLVLKNCDELFEREELSAVPDVGWPDCFNSGVFVFSPCYETYSKLLQLAETEGSFDGADQGLLNTYFSDWRVKNIEKHLSFIYNMVASSTYTYEPAFKQFGKNVKIVHFLGELKPWLHAHLSSTGEFKCCEKCSSSKNSLDLWWEIYNEKVRDKSTDDKAGISKEIVKLDVKCVECIAENQLNKAGASCSRQHLWEQGQIDYLGEDSFDSVQKKLDEVIQPKKKK